MDDDALRREIARARAFAIISHPDAGKTTLTERLLLAGGAIHQAGAVKAKGARRAATSDWMEIERKRGISVTSTVLRFSYGGYRINLLDTPGHQDFSEDTYRTLAAADSAVMLIDAAKGIEPQTLKLFQVCRQRRIPIFTFINKLDREGRDPWDLLREIEQVLHLETYPVNWPVGMGGRLQGVYDRLDGRFERFPGRGEDAAPIPAASVDDPSLALAIGSSEQQSLAEDVTLLDEAGIAWDHGRVLAGDLTPVFFGSALTGFGVVSFLCRFLEWAPPPGPRLTENGTPVPPDRADFSGFVFKIQANMNPAHRDRVAFIRICSGRFERGMTVRHVPSDRRVNLAQSQEFFGQERVTVDEAFPGDIIGVHDPGLFRIGDTLASGAPVAFERLPLFSPEEFARIATRDTGKYKQFKKGLEQLGEEGAVQIFRSAGRTEDLVVGVLGTLQFDVFRYRLEHEYGAEPELTPLPYRYARWIRPEDLDRLEWDRATTLLVRDREGRPVLLFTDEFRLNWTAQQNPRVPLYPTSYELDRADALASR